MAEENKAEENQGAGDNRRDRASSRYVGIGVALGTGAGTAWFAATNDPIWIALGAALGAGLGAAFSSASARDD